MGVKKNAVVTWKYVKPDKQEGKKRLNKKRPLPPQVNCPGAGSGSAEDKCNPCVSVNESVSVLKLYYSVCSFTSDTHSSACN